MQEPSLRTSRLAIAGGLAAVIVVGGAGFFFGRSTAPQPAEPVPVSSPTPEPSPTQPARMLNRADIISIAAQAADALASGEPLPEDVRATANRRFELALPFGCAGPAGENGQAPLRWRYDEDEEVLRLHVAPTSWRPVEWGVGENTGIEAVEGFWLARPWSSDVVCPQRAHAAPTGTEPITLPGQTLAIAQFFTGTDRRAALRDDRPFETVQRVPLGQFDAARGFRVLLTGRIDRVPGGGPVRCIQPAGIEQRPICVVAVVLDEVRIENPIGAEVLATWPVNSD
jgi:hypothetical protein